MAMAESVPVWLADGSIKAMTHFVCADGSEGDGITVLSPDRPQWASWDEHLRAIGE